MKKRALILTWNGYQDQEVIYPYYRMQEDNFTVNVTAENVGWIQGIMGTKIEANVEVKSLSPTTVMEYDFLIIPGGVKSLEKLRQQQNALDYVWAHVQSGQVLASTCHGAQIMISAKITKGRRISGYYSIKDDIINSGADYVDAPFVISDPIVSSPHYKHMGPWVKAALDLYYNKNA